MAKRKSKAMIMAADGAGRMVQVLDRRFEGDDWPIQFDVPTEEADTWLQYLSSECRRRGWSLTSFGQLEAKENSGSITVNSGAAEPLALAVVWERRRGGPMKVRARSAGASEFPLAQAEELFQQINVQCRARAKDQFYLRGQIYYKGLPWRGELWLTDTLRLGPSSSIDETALFGPRVILIDAQVEGIDQLDASSAFAVMLRELSVFLSVLMSNEVRVPPTGRAWTWTVAPTGEVECDVRNLGYYQQGNPPGMPASGQVPPIPLVPIQRPDFSLRGISTGDREQRLPADLIDLWRAFSALPAAQRQQFLQVGSMWQLALSLGQDYETARFSWMVAACEALKPPAPQFRDHNIYHVVEALLGQPSADLLQEQWFRPQDIRNAHLHSGEFRGSEFVQPTMMSSFRDPTFGQAGRVLAQITPAAIVEWLRRAGKFSMLPLKRRRSWRRWVKEHALFLLPILTIVGIAMGFVFGRSLGLR